MNFVNENTSMRWANRFLDSLEGAVAEVAPKAEVLSLDKPPLADRVRRAKRPLVLLDYDGTLRAFVADPRDAVPDARLLALLSGLAEHARVYIVSGRSAQTLENWFGRLPIGLVCEHGLSIKHPSQGWQDAAAVNGTALKRLVEPLFKNFVQRTPGSSIEYKQAAIAWHYRAADPEFGTLQANELLPLLEDTLHRKPYAVLRGSRVIEVRHHKVNKGRALLTILEQHADSDLVFCAGDDRTDEDLFEAIPEAIRERSITCWVGHRSALASYWVESNQALLTELETMLRLWRERPAATPGAREETRPRRLAAVAAASAERARR
jgi:trehalose 6-phosphate synthase/phosphatase